MLVQGTAAYPYINTRDIQWQDLMIYLQVPSDWLRKGYTISKCRKWQILYHTTCWKAACCMRRWTNWTQREKTYPHHHKSWTCLRDKRSALSSNCCCLTSLFSVIHCRLSSGQIMGKHRGTAFPFRFKWGNTTRSLSLHNRCGWTYNISNRKMCVKCTI